MTRKFFIMIVAVLMMFACAGCGEQSSNNINTKPIGKDKLVVGLDEYFLPFGFRDESGEIVGFDVDLAKETMKRLGYEVEFKPIEWANKENELNSGNIDMIWNGLEVTDERQKNMLFTRPYMSSGQIVFVYHSNQYSLITDKSKLAGMSVGIQGDSTSEAALDLDNELKFTLKEIKIYSDTAAAFDDLTKRMVDAVIADEINGRYYIFKNGLENKIDALSISISDKGDIAVGFRKNDIRLRDEVQKTFDSMVADGTAKRISKKWFGKDLILDK